MRNRTVQTHLATWLELTCDCRQGAAGPAPIERAFRRYLECGILANGFARARCAECGQDFLIDWSCKGRGVCPACNTRRMVETAAHLADHVLPRLPVRQWALSVPKRLRYQLEHDPGIETLTLRIFLSVVEQRCPDRGRCLVLACLQHHPKTAERLRWHTFWPARTPAANALQPKRTPRLTPCFAGFFVYTS
ncbi:transposase zinc-binding domain-containing protein [Candidatus Accumulibacter propinquus]|uniref:transposase zinc-binding domain-containing protein n=1 Tax=Candidatus Accumulibacter propinquus TaxID=2954380 RepID=UPI003DA7B41F